MEHKDLNKTDSLPSVPADKLVATSTILIVPFPTDACLVSKMARSTFFKNYRVYMLTAVAYMGSLLFGTLI